MLNNLNSNLGSAQTSLAVSEKEIQDLENRVDTLEQARACDARCFVSSTICANTLQANEIAASSCVSTDSLQATHARFDSAATDSLVAGCAEIESISGNTRAENLTVETLNVENTVGNLQITNSNINNLQAVTSRVQTETVDNLTVNETLASKAIGANTAVFDESRSTNETVTNLTANKVTATTETVQNLNASIAELTNAEIGYLAAEFVNADQANFVKASIDELSVKAVKYTNVLNFDSQLLTDSDWYTIEIPDYENALIFMKSTFNNKNWQISVLKVGKTAYIQYSQDSLSCIKSISWDSTNANGNIRVAVRSSTELHYTVNKIADSKPDISYVYTGPSYSYEHIPERLQTYLFRGIGTNAISMEFDGLAKFGLMEAGEQEFAFFSVDDLAVNNNLLLPSSWDSSGSVEARSSGKVGQVVRVVYKNGVLKPCWTSPIDYSETVGDLETAHELWMTSDIPTEEHIALWNGKTVTIDNREDDFDFRSTIDITLNENTTEEDFLDWSYTGSIENKDFVVTGYVDPLWPPITSVTYDGTWRVNGKTSDHIHAICFAGYEKYLYPITHLGEGTVTHGDHEIEGSLDVDKELEVAGKITAHEAVIEKDLAIHGDLYVAGTTTTTNSSEITSSGNYVITRENQETVLADNERSGLVVNNYGEIHETIASGNLSSLGYTSSLLGTTVNLAGSGTLYYYEFSLPSFVTAATSEELAYLRTIDSSLQSAYVVPKDYAIAVNAIPRKSFTENGQVFYGNSVYVYTWYYTLHADEYAGVGVIADGKKVFSASLEWNDFQVNNIGFYTGTQIALGNLLAAETELGTFITRVNKASDLMGWTFTKNNDENYRLIIGTTSVNTTVVATNGTISINGSSSLTSSDPSIVVTFDGIGSAAIAVDNSGTWRVSNTYLSETTTYSNIASWNSVYFDGTSIIPTTAITIDIPTAVVAGELPEVIRFEKQTGDTLASGFYAWTGSEWIGPLTWDSTEKELIGESVDSSLYSELENYMTQQGIEKAAYIYYESVTSKTIDKGEEQAILTRDEADNLENNKTLIWDASESKAKTAGWIVGRNLCFGDIITATSPINCGYGQMQAKLQGAPVTLALDYVTKAPASTIARPRIIGTVNSATKADIYLPDGCHDTLQGVSTAKNIGFCPAGGHEGILPVWGSLPVTCLGLTAGNTYPITCVNDAIIACKDKIPNGKWILQPNCNIGITGLGNETVCTGDYVNPLSVEITGILTPKSCTYNTFVYCQGSKIWNVSLCYDANCNATTTVCEISGSGGGGGGSVDICCNAASLNGQIVTYNTTTGVLESRSNLCVNSGSFIYAQNGLSSGYEPTEGSNFIVHIGTDLYDFSKVTESTVIGRCNRIALDGGNEAWLYCCSLLIGDCNLICIPSACCVRYSCGVVIGDRNCLCANSCDSTSRNNITTVVGPDNKVWFGYKDCCYPICNSDFSTIVGMKNCSENGNNTVVGGLNNAFASGTTLVGYGNHTNDFAFSSVAIGFWNQTCAAYGVVIGTFSAVCAGRVCYECPQCEYSSIAIGLRAHNYYDANFGGPVGARIVESTGDLVRIAVKIRCSATTRDLLWTVTKVLSCVSKTDEALKASPWFVQGCLALFSRACVANCCVASATNDCHPIIMFIRCCCTASSCNTGRYYQNSTNCNLAFSGSEGSYYISGSTPTCYEGYGLLTAVRWHT